MWLLKNFFGHFPLEYGIYVSVLWNFLILMVFCLDEIAILIAFVELCIVVLMLYSFCMRSNNAYFYLTWMMNKLALAAIFGIGICVVLSFASFKETLIIFPILTILFSLEIYFGMIAFSMYCDKKNIPGIVVSPPGTSKGPSDANLHAPSVIVSSRASDIRLNPLFVLPYDHGIVPSCPSSSTYFDSATVIYPETVVCDSVHQPFLPYQIQPAFNPEFQPPTISFP